MSTKDLHNKFIISMNSINTSNANKSIIPEGDFLNTYREQYKTNTAYKNYSNSLPSTPLTHINDIPALPTDAFKYEPNPTSLTQEEIQTTFLTSGTTTETKGKHHFATTKTYEASILKGWEYCELPKLSNKHTFILTPSPEEAPHSSLSHMMETLKQQHAPTAQYILNNGTISSEAIQTIISLSEKSQPITLLGTALAFLQFFETLEKHQSTPLIFPEGSWALETGGYKGTAKSLTKEELYQLFLHHLGIPANQIWNEYSMTELSSQFYTQGLGNPHTAPPWVHIKVINPETNLPVKAGEMGYLVIYDLANIDSAIGIRTQDLAIYHTPQSFTLIGRDPSALPRGCSRSL